MRRRLNKPSNKHLEYLDSNTIMLRLGISERTFRYRIKELSNKYQNNKNLISKTNNKWRIHYSLMDEFNSKYKPRKETAYNTKWKSFITWVPRDSYDVLYHLLIIDEVKQELPSVRIEFQIEETRNGCNHVHGLSDANDNIIRPALKKVMDKYFKSYEVRYDVEPVLNNYKAINYLNKQK